MTQEEKENRIHSFALEFLERQQIVPNLYADQIIRGYKEGYLQAEQDLEVKEVEVPVSNDLEEAIKKYLTSLRKSHFEGYDIERAFKKGAQWQKKQTENDDEKLSKAVKLADAMYYAAHQLTTDASHLMETMKDWWNFKNVELNNKE